MDEQQTTTANAEIEDSGDVPARRGPRRLRTAVAGLFLAAASLAMMASPASAHTGAYQDPLLACQASGYARVTTTTTPVVSATAGTQWVYWRPEFWIWDEYTRRWHFRSYGSLGGNWARAQARAGSWTSAFYNERTGQRVAGVFYEQANGTNNTYVVNRIKWWIDGAWHSANPYSHFGNNYACTQTGLGN